MTASYHRGYDDDSSGYDDVAAGTKKKKKIYNMDLIALCLELLLMQMANL